MKLLFGVLAVVLMVFMQRHRRGRRRLRSPSTRRKSGARSSKSFPPPNTTGSMRRASSPTSPNILDKLGKKIRDLILWRGIRYHSMANRRRVASFIFASLVLIGFAALVVLLIRKLLGSGRSRELMSRPMIWTRYMGSPFRQAVDSGGRVPCRGRGISLGISVRVYGLDIAP